MRAIYLQEIIKSNEIEVVGDTCHHLAMVTRLEVGEEVLVLNGQGRRLTCLSEQVTKKVIKLKVLNDETVERKINLDLALGIPKKDALELCLKQATELGIRKIYLIRSEFSQIKVPEMERIQSLLINALEQSNNAYLPEVYASDWGEIPWDSYNTATMLDSQTDQDKLSKPCSGNNHLLIVGPEGGFSASELAFLRQRPNLNSLHLPTPILRTPTAVAAGVGFVLRSLMDR